MVKENIEAQQQAMQHHSRGTMGIGLLTRLTILTIPRCPQQQPFEPALTVHLKFLIVDSGPMASPPGAFEDGGLLAEMNEAFGTPHCNPKPDPGHRLEPHHPMVYTSSSSSS